MEKQENEKDFEITLAEKSVAELKRTGKAVAQLGMKTAAAPLPQSISWIYGLGFKIGVLLILKSFLVIRYLRLSVSGWWIVATQFVMSLGLIVFGLIMQHPPVSQNRSALFRLSLGYGAVTVWGALICWLREHFAWEYFQKVENANWFINIVNHAQKTIGDIGLSVIFWDADLWTFFCFILCILSALYALIAVKNS